MRTTLVIILSWGLASILLCVLGLTIVAFTTQRSDSPDADPMKQVVLMLAQDADHAFEEDGKTGLTSYLHRLNMRLPGQRFLVDDNGTDLIDATDRSSFAPSQKPSKFHIASLPDGRLSAATEVGSKGRRFIWVVRPWFRPPSLTSSILVVVGVLAAMATSLAFYLSVPLRRLKSVMDRFGNGDLTARVHSTRRDEIGAVSKEFDILAARVETLVNSQRRLLQDVSHELRSPLTRLDVAVDLAMKRNDPGQLLERIRRDVTRLTLLVGELLQLTRSEGDPTTRVQKVVNLSDLLNAVTDDCAIEAETKGCRLEIQSTWSGSIEGDPELLRRTFENVIRNSIRYAPKGSAVSTLIECHDQSAVITIRDSGPGVPNDDLENIFEPFFRVESDRSRETGGVGLGLAIARRAVQIHKGSIVATNLNPGLAVEIKLPAVEPK